MDLRRVWESRAAQWRDWARTPRHDSYWAYSGGFFDEIVPQDAGVVLDIGCGEGRVTRALANRARQVTGIDSSPTLVRDAADADGESDYLVADATMLPFRDGSFDTVVAYNSLMDLDDMPRGVAEAARVLRPNGRFCVCVLHPFGDAGEFASDDEDAPFLVEDYLVSHRYDQRHERDGLEMTFTSWHHPLARYTEAFETAGLPIERLREPLPDFAALGRRQWTRAERIPMFLFLRAVKR
ncbi:MAG: class I SAM-dependent methyltransferase [Actinomycetota bacterium]|nr:class I SAM-dependent methyltransferase [Actinomycetota bacterium]